MSTVTITLPEDRMIELEQVASRYRIAPEELARMSVEDMLMQPEQTFARALDRVLDKNEELYRRLA